MSRVTENQLTKLYYTIGEVAAMFDVNTSLIRFWEKEFPVIQPKKNKKGKRLFTSKEILKIDIIYTLVKEEGYTLDGARKALKEKKTVTVHVEPEEDGELLKKLESIKAKLISLKSS